MSLPALDVARVRKDFPILERSVHGQRLAFLDSAASAQKPRQLIETLSRFYAHDYANIHRGVYELSEVATRRYEESREKVARRQPRRMRDTTTLGQCVMSRQYRMTYEPIASSPRWPVEGDS